MADPKLDSIKDKLKKLIEKEASCREIGNIAEAEAFAAKIQQLLMDYELEIEEVMGHNNKEVVGDELFDTSTLTLRNESNWIMLLYRACAPSAFCRVFTLPQRYSRNSTWGEVIALFGSENHREILHFMVAQLSNKCRNAARKSFSTYTGESKKNTYIRSFLKGCAAGIDAKLKQQQQYEEANRPQVQGIVLNRGLMVTNFIKQWLRDNGMKAKTSTANTVGSSMDGYAEGYKNGRETNINHGVKPTGSPKLLN